MIELASALGWLFTGVGFFFLVALIFDKYGSHKSIPKEDLTVEKTSLETIPEYPDQEKNEFSEFIKGLPMGPSFIGMDAEGNYPGKKPEVRENPDKINEFYPERLLDLRTHKGFRSISFEDLWRDSTGNNLKV